MPPHDEVEIEGLFAHDVDVPVLLDRLRQAGVGDKQIHVLSPVPLSDRASDRMGRLPLYAVTIGAGLVGIAVGVFFAAGTALMYPLMTGGKPIVAAPVVGIISYETMMLLAIVLTFVTMLVRIKHTNGEIRSRNVRIDDGRIAVVVSVPMFGHAASTVRGAMEQSGALGRADGWPCGGSSPAPCPRGSLYRLFPRYGRTSVVPSAGSAATAFSCPKRAAGKSGVLARPRRGEPSAGRSWSESLPH
jgi:hypothetical protein